MYLIGDYDVTDCEEEFYTERQY